MKYRFNPPPAWPKAPDGWTPSVGWQPPADWPPLPESWQLWVPESPPEALPDLPPSVADEKSAVFGARRRVRQLTEENAALRDAALAARERVTRAENQLRDTTTRNTTLVAQLEDLAARYASLRGKDGVTLDRELQQARRHLTKLTAAAGEQQAADARGHAEALAELAGVRRQAEAVRSELAQARQQIVETHETALLQEAGIYEYRHPLADAVAYKSALAQLKDAIKTAAKNNHAITAGTSWTVNNSAVEGQRMVRDFSKLMLRAYNAEADNCVRSMRPHRLDSSKDRLDKTRDIISRLGKTMHIAIAPDYHRLRVQELELTSDHLAKVEQEKERQRAERERQRDEEQARREFEREKARLAKERSHWENAMAKWSDDVAKATEARAKMAEIDEAIRGVEEREANIRTGNVYVISNIGSFGEGVVKIGLTRRMNPMERVRELGDASVPFKFDVHAIIFDADAVTLERLLHDRFAERRVNRVNTRREFFHATPDEVLAALQDLGRLANVIEYVEEPEAQEWRSSKRMAEAG